jgi:hypothetical protein
MNFKPTLEEITELYEACKNYYGELQTAYDRDETFYELNFKTILGLPKEFEQDGVVLPTARDLLDACVDHTDIHNARVFVNRKGTSAKSEEATEMMRKFYLGLINRIEQENQINPFRVAAKHYWLHGLGVLKTLWDADHWPDKPEQKKGEADEDYAIKIDKWRADRNLKLPVLIQAVHPRNILIDPSGAESYVFEARPKTVYNVKLMYPRWSNPKDKKITESVEHVSFWTPKYRCELYDGEPILRTKDGIVEHNYGFVPYVFIESGLGNINSTNDPVRRYVGILRYVTDLLISESRNYSTSDAVLKRTAWPYGVIKGAHADQVETVEQTFGTYTRLPPDTEIIQLTPEAPPNAIMNLLAIASSTLAAHAAPNAIRGLSESGVRSGTDRRQLIAEASTKYIYAKEAFKNGAARVLANSAKLVKNVIPGDFDVWARTPTDEFDVEIKKDQMKEPFTCYIEFAPVSEEDEYTRHDDLERLVQSNIVPAKWATTQMSNVDPVQIEVDKQVDLIMKAEPVQQLLIQYASGKIMEALTKKARAEAAKNPPPAIEQSPTLMTPGQGTPQTPGQPGQTRSPVTPLYEMPSQTDQLDQQLSGLRSQTPMNPMQGFGGGGS